jgi:fructokinase
LQLVNFTIRAGFDKMRCNFQREYSMIQAVSFGELLVDMVSESDVSLADAPRFLKAPGGAPANVAVGLQRLGVSTRFVGQVGNDPFGDWLREIVERENVDVEYLLQSEVARTTVAFVATRNDGKKDICFYRNPGADALFPVEAATREVLSQARIFHCGSVSLSQNPCRDAQFQLARLAREAGVLVSFDPNWRPSIWDDHAAARELIWQMMKLSDVAKVADEEWEFITGTSDLKEGAKKIREAGPKLVVVTRGSDGAYFDFEGGSGEVASFSVKAVDTLGAGDAFVAGLLSQLLEYSDLDAALTEPNLQCALTFANACGAIATQKAGAIPALPSREEVEEFLQQSI